MLQGLAVGGSPPHCQCPLSCFSPRAAPGAGGKKGGKEGGAVGPPGGMGLSPGLGAGGFVGEAAPCLSAPSPHSA